MVIGAALGELAPADGRCVQGQDRQTERLRGRWIPRALTMKCLRPRTAIVGEVMAHEVMAHEVTAGAVIDVQMGEQSQLVQAIQQRYGPAQTPAKGATMAATQETSDARITPIAVIGRQMRMVIERPQRPVRQAVSARPSKAIDVATTNAVGQMELEEPSRLESEPSGVNSAEQMQHRVCFWGAKVLDSEVIELCHLN